MPIFQKLLSWLKRRHRSKRISQILCIAFALNLIFAIGFYFAEKPVNEGLTFSDSVWWAMVTMTTVGYGDFYAQTLIGRFLISYPAMFVGIGIMGYLIGEIATLLIEKQSRRKRGMEQIKSTQHVIICNYPCPERITELVSELKATPAYQQAKFVIVTNEISELPQSLLQQKIAFVKGDPAKLEVLQLANLQQASGVMILAADEHNPASDDKTFVIGSVIHNFRRTNQLQIKIILELLSTQNMSAIKVIQPEGIVTQDRVTDKLLVQEFLYPGLHNIFQQIVSNMEGSQLYITETQLTGYKVQDIQMKVIQHPEDIQVIGVIRQNQYILNPSKQMIIENGDKLVILAEDTKDMARIEQDLLADSQVSPTY